MKSKKDVPKRSEIITVILLVFIMSMLSFMQQISDGGEKSFFLQNLLVLSAIIWVSIISYTDSERELRWISSVADTFLFLTYLFFGSLLVMNVTNISQFSSGMDIGLKNALNNSSMWLAVNTYSILALGSFFYGVYYLGVQYFHKVKAIWMEIKKQKKRKKKRKK